VITFRVTATRSVADGHWILIGSCPLCHQQHTHGGGTGQVPLLGHRVAHCLTRKPGDGYQLTQEPEPQGDDWPTRLAQLVDQTKARRTTRRQLRQDHAAQREAGLRARHAAKLSRPAGHDGADSGETHRTVPTVR
jgi:hypothetical protein